MKAQCKKCGDKMDWSKEAFEKQGGVCAVCQAAMKAQHTQGNWTCELDCNRGLWPKGPDGKQIANCPGHPEAEANARLIAAAPELLAACEFAAGILSKIPAFGDSLGNKVSKAQIGIALNRLMVAATKTVSL